MAGYMSLVGCSTQAEPFHTGRMRVAWTDTRFSALTDRKFPPLTFTERIVTPSYCFLMGSLARRLYHWAFSEMLVFVASTVVRRIRTSRSEERRVGKAWKSR